MFWLSQFPKISGSKKRNGDNNKLINIKLLKQSFQNKGNKDNNKDEEEFNKGMELENVWGKKIWNKIIKDIKKPKTKWNT